MKGKVEFSLLQQRVASDSQFGGCRFGSLTNRKQICEPFSLESCLLKKKKKNTSTIDPNKLNHSSKVQAALICSNYDCLLVCQSNQNPRPSDPVLLK